MTSPGPGRHDSSPDEEEAAWRAIVENYGERPELPDLPADNGVGGAAADRAAVERAARERAAREQAAREHADDEWAERFVPPDPPPLPRPDPPVLVAWLGVLGAPLALMAVVVFSIGVPVIIGLGLAVWFLGGFAYLVSAMPSEPRDPGDDGAQV
ncbi:MAG: hypothetical protein U0R80_11750 [Nocardioidaceae bacterium]